MKLSLQTLKQSQTGASHIVVAVALIVAGVVGFTGYRLQKMSSADTITFGQKTIASTQETLNANYKISSPYTPTSAGKVTSMSLYLNGNASSSGSGTVRTAIYADNAGKPGNLLGYSAAKSIPAGQAAGWVDFTFGNQVSITAGTKYWLTATAGDKSVVRIYRGTTADTKVWGANAGGAVPTAAYGTANLAAGPMSVYATYTTSATTPTTPTPPTTPTTPTTPTPPTTPTTPLTTVKLMPLGDSITLGWNYYPGTSLPAPGGYRALLWQKLVQQDGKKIDFVGSLSSGPSTLGDKNHEGHSGERIDQIRAGIDSYMASAQPDVVLLTIGTNDMLQNYSVSAAPTRLQDLVDRICVNRPATRIVVSTIPPRPGLDSRVNAYNAAIPGVVTTSQGKGCKTTYFNMNSYMVAGDLAPSDNTHPTPAGYDKMAEAWYPYVSNLYTQMTQ